jgi:hypothetical protein
VIGINAVFVEIDPSLGGDRSKTTFQAGSTPENRHIEISVRHLIEITGLFCALEPRDHSWGRIDIGD